MGAADEHGRPTTGDAQRPSPMPSPTIGATDPNTSLNLSGNRLDNAVVAKLARYPRLTVLVLDDNNIQSLPGLPATLTRLSVKNNMLTNMEWLSHLTELSTLNLRQNRIKALPALPGLGKLTHVDISDNLFADVRGLASWPQLKVLRVMSCLLDSVPDFLETLRRLGGNLATLDARDNPMTRSFYPAPVPTPPAGADGKAPIRPPTLVEYDEAHPLEGPAGREAFGQRLYYRAAVVDILGGALRTLDGLTVSNTEKNIAEALPEKVVAGAHSNGGGGADPAAYRAAGVARNLGVPPSPSLQFPTRFERKTKLMEEDAAGGRREEEEDSPGEPEWKQVRCAVVAVLTRLGLHDVGVERLVESQGSLEHGGADVSLVEFGEFARQIGMTQSLADISALYEALYTSTGVYYVDILAVVALLARGPAEDKLEALLGLLASLDYARGEGSGVYSLPAPSLCLLVRWAVVSAAQICAALLAGPVGSAATPDGRANAARLGEAVRDLDSEEALEQLCEETFRMFGQGEDTYVLDARWVAAKLAEIPLGRCWLEVLGATAAAEPEPFRPASPISPVKGPVNRQLEMDPGEAPWSPGTYPIVDRAIKDLFSPGEDKVATPARPPRPPSTGERLRGLVLRMLRGQREEYPNTPGHAAGRPPAREWRSPAPPAGAMPREPEDGGHDGMQARFREQYRAMVSHLAERMEGSGVWGGREDAGALLAEGDRLARSLFRDDPAAAEVTPGEWERVVAEITRHYLDASAGGTGAAAGEAMVEDAVRSRHRDVLEDERRRVAMYQPAEEQLELKGRDDWDEWAPPAPAPVPPPPADEPEWVDAPLIRSPRGVMIMNSPETAPARVETQTQTSPHVKTPGSPAPPPPPAMHIASETEEQEETEEREPDRGPASPTWSDRINRTYGLDTPEAAPRAPAADEVCDLLQLQAIAAPRAGGRAAIRVGSGVCAELNPGSVEFRLLEQLMRLQPAHDNRAYALVRALKVHNEAQIRGVVDVEEDPGAGGAPVRLLFHAGDRRMLGRVAKAGFGAYRYANSLVFSDNLLLADDVARQRESAQPLGSITPGAPPRRVNRRVLLALVRVGRECRSNRPLPLLIEDGDGGAGGGGMYDTLLYEAPGHSRGASTMVYQSLSPELATPAYLVEYSCWQ